MASDRRKSVKDPELGRLLAGKPGPSVLEKEAAFEDVLDGVDAKRRRPWLPWVSFGVAVSTAALALFTLRPPIDEFAKRGSPGPVFRPHCLHAGAASDCMVGGKLLFEVRAPESHPHLAVFARRPDGAVIWYLPGPEAQTATVSSVRPTVLETGFELGADHPEGSYTVFAIFSAGPETRASLKRQLDESLEAKALIEVQRPLVIHRATTP